MSSAGLDRRTGKPLTGFDHVVQSVEVILTTLIGSRVMRRTFGAALLRLLGENTSSETIMRATMAIALALELWEPRFALKQVVIGENSPESLRQGGLRMSLIGEYRPRGHLGDMTPAGMRTITIGA